MALKSLPRAGAVSTFLKERLDFYLREVRGFAYDVVNAVLSTGLTTVTDAIARAQALTKVRGSDDLVAISTAFKRIKNILRQAEAKQDGDSIASDISSSRQSNGCTPRRQKSRPKSKHCVPGRSTARLWNEWLRFAR